MNSIEYAQLLLHYSKLVNILGYFERFLLDINHVALVILEILLFLLLEMAKNFRNSYNSNSKF